MSRTADLLVVLLSFIVFSCSGGNDGQGRGYEPVPRQDGWPRICMYDSALRALPGLPVNIEVNAAATVVMPEDRPGSADIVYPRFGATVYLTLVSGLDDPDRFKSVWDNRMERMSRNIGTTAADAANGRNGAGFHTVLLTASSLTQTPVQLLAGNPERGEIVSATAFFHNRPESYDSVRPVIDAVRFDLDRMAARLR